MVYMPQTPYALTPALSLRERESCQRISSSLCLCVKKANQHISSSLSRAAGEGWGEGACGIHIFQQFYPLAQ